VSVREISNSDDVIDSRDVIARIEELEEERQSIIGDTAEDTAARLVEWDEDNAEELRALKSLADEASGYAADWQHGETLIRDSYFEDYAQQLADDLGLMQGLDGGLRWPFTCIDWAQAARELQQDYTSVDFDGVTYWIR
jgi:hypothetical protein